MYNNYKLQFEQFNMICTITTNYNKQVCDSINLNNLIWYVQ